MAPAATLEKTTESPTAQELSTLRELARRVADLAAAPIQAAREKLWTDHNDLKPGRPLVLAFPEGAWRELLPEAGLVCRHPRLRALEADFRRRLYHGEILGDENPIEAAVRIPLVMHSTQWGLQANRSHSADSLGAHHFEPVLNGPDDLARLTAPELTVDHGASAEDRERVSEWLEGILPVEPVCPLGTGIAPMDHYSQLRGLDRIFTDLVDEEAFVHEAMGRLVDGEIAMRRSLEAQGALTLNLRGHYAGSGGNSYTGSLPSPSYDGKRVTTRDLWGFAAAQIFSEVSPAMHEAFALEHERRFLDLFGLNSYACCEPLTRKMEPVLRLVPRLRRVSISAWADFAVCAEQLGGRAILSWKPNPAALAGEGFDGGAIARELREKLAIARRCGCVVEIIMKDTHTLRHDPRRLVTWIRLAKEAAAEA
ncbi:MAG: hypothetical protein J0L75_14200 [Spirochaetes bacterium]|nr:hypothetical protein [Spirochaetota bacterium]